MPREIEWDDVKDDGVPIRTRVRRRRMSVLRLVGVLCVVASVVGTATVFAGTVVRVVAQRSMTGAERLALAETFRKPARVESAESVGSALMVAGGIAVVSAIVVAAGAWAYNGNGGDVGLVRLATVVGFAGLILSNCFGGLAYYPTSLIP